MLLMCLYGSLSAVRRKSKEVRVDTLPLPPALVLAHILALASAFLLPRILLLLLLLLWGFLHSTSAALLLLLLNERVSLWKTRAGLSRRHA